MGIVCDAPASADSKVSTSCSESLIASFCDARASPCGVSRPMRVGGTRRAGAERAGWTRGSASRGTGARARATARRRAGGTRARMDGREAWCAYGGRFLSSSEARALDEDLIAGVGCVGSSLEALMRRAGRQAATATLEAASDAERFCVLCGPGNNGGDGLVLARECATRRSGAEVMVWYPKGPGGSELYAKLAEECRRTPGVTFVDEETVSALVRSHLDKASATSTCFVDALFGFSFRGPVREPYVGAIRLLTALTLGEDARERRAFTVSLDVPSGWSVDGTSEGDCDFVPDLLISLTAPKRCCATLDDPALGDARSARLKRLAQTHVVAGSFLTDEMCEKYGLQAIPLREGSSVDYVPLDLSRRESS